MAALISLLMVASETRTGWKWKALSVLCASVVVPGGGAKCQEARASNYRAEGACPRSYRKRIWHRAQGLSSRRLQVFSVVFGQESATSVRSATKTTIPNSHLTRVVLSALSRIAPGQTNTSYFLAQADYYTIRDEKKKKAGKDI